MRIAALLLGSIEAPHEASSQLARASEVTSHPTCSMFDCEPPELEDYLSDFDPAYYAGLGLPI